MNGINESQKIPRYAQNVNPPIGTVSVELKKKCSKCGVEKDYSEFYKKVSASDGLQNICKKCCKAYSNIYQHRRKEMVGKRERKKQIEIETQTKKCPTCNEIKPFSEFGKDKTRKAGIRYDCKICSSLFNKNYNQKNKVKNSTQSKIYREKNKDRRKSYLLGKRETDIGFKLKGNVRTRIIDALKPTGLIKTAKAMDLLGCSIDHFKSYLENQFKQGMTWKNYGFYGWHMDHIRPCSSFNLADPEQQRECFHYSNMQPLWAEDNLSKGSKII